MHQIRFPASVRSFFRPSLRWSLTLYTQNRRLTKQTLYHCRNCACVALGLLNADPDRLSNSLFGQSIDLQGGPRK